MQAYSFAEAQHLTMGPDWNLLTRWNWCEVWSHVWWLLLNYPYLRVSLADLWLLQLHSPLFSHSTGHWIPTGKCAPEVHEGPTCMSLVHPTFTQCVTVGSVPRIHSGWAGKGSEMPANAKEKPVILFQLHSVPWCHSINLYFCMQLMLVWWQLLKCWVIVDPSA